MKIPAECAEGFHLEFLFLAPDNRSRLGLGIAYDTLGKASRVALNREVSCLTEPKRTGVLRTEGISNL
jgi:hypothetical protein